MHLLQFSKIIESSSGNKHFKWRFEIFIFISDKFCVSLYAFIDNRQTDGYTQFFKIIFLFQSSKEAQFLANQVMLYYGGDEREKLTLLNNFHDSPNSFKHMDLVNQIEKLDLGALNVK